MKQKFVREVKGHFNLRKPKGEEPTEVYFVVYLEGKQYKLSSGMKVYPNQWDSIEQQAIESNQLSRLDNRNNKLLNAKINRIRCSFVNFLEYLCRSEVDYNDIGELLKSYIYKDMKQNKRTKTDFDAVRIINDALGHYYSYNSQVKRSTLKQYENLLNLFTDYLEKKNLVNYIDVFTQGGLNDYRNYLMDRVRSDEKFGINRLNDAVRLIERLINKVLIVESSYLQYNLTRVTFVNLDDKRTQADICRFPFYDNEIQDVIGCSTLTEREQEYRTVFLLQCECGLRVSDLKKLMNGEGEIKDGIISVLTKKEDNKGLYAQVRITPRLRQYLYDEVPQFKCIKVNKFYENHYNETLKIICKKAGLERIINWKDSKGKKHNSKLHEVVVNHDCRHTFITNKVKEGVPYDVICEMTGHADDRMIKEVYANLTKEDKRDKVSKYYKEQAKIKESAIIQIKRSVIDSVFGYEKLMQLFDLYKNGTDIIRLPLTKECVQVILSTSSFSKALEKSKDKDLTQLKEKTLELYEIVRVLTMTTLNPNIYHIYEYKLFKFGFIKEMMPIEMIEEMFREPTEEEIAQAQLEEHIEWLNRK